MRTLLSLLGSLALVVLGSTAFAYAEADDSPGGQLLGALIAIYGLWLGWRTMAALRNR